jgi:hypothetical protein
MYCAHGGSCYPADGVQLTNCRVGALCKECSDKDTRFYDVDIIRSKFSVADLKTYDLANRLEQLCADPCAWAGAYSYFHKPRSVCAQNVRAALEGDANAINTLGRVCMSK